jgi:hypothetical protein
MLGRTLLEQHLVQHCALLPQRLAGIKHRSHHRE